MTGMLASVKNKEEVLQILATNIHIIDLKQPSKGALGALEAHLVDDIVKTVNKKSLVSATIGDLPMQPDLVFNAVKVMAATGVDYVKIGVFPEGDTIATLKKLTELKQSKVSMIAVLFADALPSFNIIEVLKTTGFKGIMLDTMNKHQGSLRQVMDFKQIAAFVTQAKKQQLLCGLAGSLRENDIKDLLKLNPDYLGFRGALCQQHNRVAQLDNQAIIKIQKAMNLI